MRNIRKYLKEKKGINTILAALLMVVIVVVASVMVYAWSTGLLGSLLVQPNVGKESLLPDTSAFPCNPTCNNVTITIRNSGTIAVTLQTYYVKDSSGNVWQLNNWALGPTIQPSTAVPANFPIGTACSSCTYSGASGAFQTFAAGTSYTVLVVTSRNNQFTFNVQR